MRRPRAAHEVSGTARRLLHASFFGQSPPLTSCAALSLYLRSGRSWGGAFDHGLGWPCSVGRTHLTAVVGGVPRTRWAEQTRHLSVRPRYFSGACPRKPHFAQLASTTTSAAVKIAASVSIGANPISSGISSFGSGSRLGTWNRAEQRRQLTLRPAASAGARPLNPQWGASHLNECRRTDWRERSPRFFVRTAAAQGPDEVQARRKPLFGILGQRPANRRTIRLARGGRDWGEN